ncbi:MAG: S8 family serine peptidase [Hyphomicrobiaceae bacterium]|nr:S8 family serine peptidase [Hyphomicrobiaceae bacterium]
MRLLQLLMITALSLMAVQTANAQAPDDSRALQQLLQKRFGQLKHRGHKPGGAVRGAVRKGFGDNDFYVISPDGKIRQSAANPTPPPSQPADDKSNGASQQSPGLFARLRALIGWGKHNDTGEKKRLIERIREKRKAFFEALLPPRRRDVHIRKNVYTVQFKPSLTEAELDQFLAEFKLEVIRAVPVLGIVYVRRKSSRPRRRLLLPGARKRARAHIARLKRELFAPMMLKRMRAKPYVNAATVQSSLTPQTMPPPSATAASATVTDGQSKKFYWSWRPNDTAGSANGDDGNWGLKRMRVPAAWNILSSMRLHGQTGKAPFMTFLDTGFGWHEHLTYTRIHGISGTRPPPITSPTCGGSHGTHVAGIAGAAYGLGRGIDGIVPGATIEAIPITSSLYITALKEQIEDRREQQVLIFSNVLENLIDFLVANPVEAGRKRIVNVSLTYNWRAVGAEISDTGELVDEGLRTHVINHAKMIQFAQRLVGRDTIFVVAAGNDSQGLKTPLSAKWASPFAYLGHDKTHIERFQDNILIVEAVDRTGNRASFSNVGGQEAVSAPGTEIMSTLSGRRDAYGLCAGTSQAAPHVTALAALLAEIAPKKTAAEIVAIIRESAVEHPTHAVAPRVDALEAILRASPDALRVLADLNGDGEVNADDIETYRRHYLAMTTASAIGRYFFDLNLDGRVEDNEHWYPRIDLNGSGSASSDPVDRRCIKQQLSNDLDVIYRAWTDKKTTFETAVAQSGLVWRKPDDAGAGAAAAKSCPW